MIRIATLASAFGYDAKGNLTSGNLTGDAVWAFGYDAENRLISACKPVVAGVCSSPTVNATYLYDPLGRRVKKSGPGVSNTYFLDDGDDEIAEYNNGQSLTVLYVPGPAIDEPVAMVTPSGGGYTHEYFHTNHQGSVIAMTDDSGALVEGPFLYDPYGTCFKGSARCSTLSSSEPYKFTGRRLDIETGLYYYRARYYWSDGGRFNQTDPVGYTADLNPYTYVGNDPVGRTDPTGRASCDASGMTSCPDIPRASSQVEQAATAAAQPQSVAAGKSEQGAVVMTSKTDNSVTRTLTGSDAGKSNPNDPQHGFNFDYKNDSSENTVAGATEHSHPASDASLREVRQATDTRNAYPSRTDLQKTMNKTKAPVIVKGPNGTISETYRVGGVDHYIVLQGPGPTTPVPSDISHNFVVGP